jgi:hypothetical protein
MYNCQRQDLCVLHHQQLKEYQFIYITLQLYMKQESVTEKETRLFLQDQVNEKGKCCVSPVEGRALAWDADSAAT